MYLDIPSVRGIPFAALGIGGVLLGLVLVYLFNMGDILPYFH